MKEPFANLTHEQKNELARKIVSRYSINDYKRSVVESEDGEKTVITHTPSGNWFSLSYNESTHHDGWVRGGNNIMFTPGYGERLSKFSEEPWRTVVSWFGMWVDMVELLQREGDLWAQSPQVTALLAPPSQATGENDPFTSAELDRIHEGFQKVIATAEQQGELTREQIGQLEQRITYLEDAATRLGRKDWLMLVAGQFLTYAQSLPVHETGLRLLEAAAEAFTWLLERIHQLPGISQ